MYHLIHAVLDGEYSEDNCPHLKGIYVDDETTVEPTICPYDFERCKKRESLEVGHHICYKTENGKGVSTEVKVNIIKFSEISNNFPVRYGLRRNLTRGTEYTPQITLEDNAILQHDTDQYVKVQGPAMEEMDKDEEKLEDFINANEKNVLFIRPILIVEHLHVQSTHNVFVRVNLYFLSYRTRHIHELEKNQVCKFLFLQT